MFRQFALILVVAGCAASAFATTDEKASTFVLCKNQKNVRTIRITGTSDSGCQITYSKAGVDEAVGSGRSEAACQSIVDNIRQNLESSRWNCRRVGSAGITWAPGTVQ